MPKRVVLNLKQARAERSITQKVIVDFNGTEHVVQPPSVDGILALMEIEAEFTAMKAAEADEGASKAELQQQQIEVIKRLGDLITAILPGFPVGGLRLDELMQIAQAMQESVAPDGGLDEDAEPGE